ncbi:MULTISPECIES: hypothetical protein [Actinomycetes]|uniref:Excreted virulence factor EspC (Type VII ESX diderm) n=1 Tax=Nocardia ignorata TaxID=145285 RepID=A0A4R6PPZ4_NOCIG|nr:hypothetical protein [Nocardia ignorata]TDP39846.1 hypothetical protein DFR75_102565 [Nocardia ignorata]
MGTQVSGGVVVDKTAMDKSVSSLRATVTEVRTAAKNVANNDWGDGTEAGRAYAAQGVRISQGLDRAVTWLRVWTTSVEATADAIGKATVEYAEVDKNTARALDQAAAK